MNTRDARDSSATVNAPDTPDNNARRVVVAPSLWAPFHHVAAVESLAAFVATVRPRGVVFMDAPGEISEQAPEAFTDVLARFRASYTGRIGVHGYGEHHEHGTGALASLRVTVMANLAPIVPGWLAAPCDITTRPGLIACAETTGADWCAGRRDDYG